MDVGNNEKIVAWLSANQKEKYEDRDDQQGLKAKTSCNIPVS